MTLDAYAAAAAVRAGEVSAESLVSSSLSRIAQQEPSVNAFTVVLAEQALSEARVLDSSPPSSLPSSITTVPSSPACRVDVTGFEGGLSTKRVYRWIGDSPALPKSEGAPRAARARAPTSEPPTILRRRWHT